VGPPVVAIFGPTGVGKTGAATELARLLAERGEHAVAVNCDSIQVYAGLEILSGAPAPQERAVLEHRLAGFVPVDEEFSAGRYADLARRELDRLLAAGTWPLVVGGTGLYLRAALTDLDLRRPVPPGIREAVELEIEREGPEAVHARLPGRFRKWVEPGDRKRITRLTELLRDGREPAADSEGGGELWTRTLRHPTVLAGLCMETDELTARISARVDTMAAAGAGREAGEAAAAGASRTARAAIGFDEFREGRLDRIKTLHRRYGRRQMTWMRRMEGVEVIDRTGLSDRSVAARILELAERGPDRQIG